MNPPRKAEVMFRDTRAGLIEETAAGFRFTYHPDYLATGTPIGTAFPLRAEPYERATLFPFFQGLLPEGWLREIVCQTLKIDPMDDFGLLSRALCRFSCEAAGESANLQLTNRVALC